MTRLLLDSHVVLWWLEDSNLAADVLTTIADPAVSVWVSVASVWELAIKEGPGRVTVPSHYVDVLAEEGIDVLGVTVAHTAAVRDLPVLHRDPFDRMLVAQARVENLTLVTRDEQLARYDVSTMRA